LGGIRLNEAQALEKRLKAAQNRKTLNEIMPSGGKRLGGIGPKEKLTMQQLKEKAVEAAERRARDAKWCGCPEDGSEIQVLDLDDDTQPSDSPVSAPVAVGESSRSKRSVALIDLTIEAFHAVGESSRSKRSVALIDLTIEAVQVRKKTTVETVIVISSDSE
jgi:hypothetical protein